METAVKALKRLFAATLALAMPAALFAENINGTKDVEKVEKKTEAVSIPEAFSFPLPIGARPFTMPQNAFESTVKFKSKDTLSDEGRTGQLHLGVDYGVTNDFQVGLTYLGDLNFKNTKDSHTLIVGLGHTTFATPIAEGMLAVDMPLTFQGDIASEVNINPMIGIGLVPKYLGLLILHDDFIKFDFGSVADKDGKNAERELGITMNLPIRLGYQITSHVRTDLGTSLGTIALLPKHLTRGEDAKTPHHFIHEKTPVTLRGFYTFSKEVDIFATAGSRNVQDIQKDLEFAVGIQFRGGALGG
jgi:hypothetical protein